MSASPSLPGLFVLSGLVATAASHVPVPPRDTAEAQLRALNHRFLHAGIDASGALVEALTHDDFVLTRTDGAWLSRADFVTLVRQQPAQPDSRIDELRVRLFGSVAVVHGVFAARRPAGPVASLRYTDVYLWSGRMWRLLSSQDTALSGPAAVPVVTGTVPSQTPRRHHDPADTDDEMLQTLNDNYVRAFREADVAWYDAHLAPDFIVVLGDGSLMDRPAALTRFARPTFADTMKSFPVADVTVRHFEDVALIHAENAYELKDGRQGTSRYTDIWHRRDGHWVCVAAHITVHRAPTARP